MQPLSPPLASGVWTWDSSALGPGSKRICLGSSLEVQWLDLGTFTAEGLGSMPSQGTKIPQAAWPKKKEDLPSQLGTF